MATAKALQVDIVTPAGAVFNATAEAVQLPGSQGSFQVLFNHAPIVSTLEAGVVKVRERAGVERQFRIDGGIVEVQANQVTVLATTATDTAAPLA